MANAEKQSQKAVRCFSTNTIHIGVVVKDLQKSIAFYKNVIGMVQVDTSSIDVDGEFSKRSALANGIPFHVEVLKLGAGDDSTQFKLMSFGDKARSKEDSFIYDHAGMQYITLMCNDLGPIIKRLEDHSIPLLSKTALPGSSSEHFILVQDPDNIFIELIGPVRQAGQAD